MIRFALSIAALLAAFAASSAHAAFGDRDCSFGVNGVQTIQGAFGGLLAAAEEPGGNLLLQYGFTSTGAEIYRIDPSGTTHTQLGGLPVAVIEDPGVALQADGKILFSNGGGFSTIPASPGVARFLAAGGLDTAFGVGGIARHAALTRASTAPAVLADGRILVGGTANGSAALVRFNADGTPDPTYGAAGAVENAAAGSSYPSMAMQGDGKVVAASANNKLWRFLPDGQLDATFGAGGSVDLASVFPNASYRLVRIQPSGKIVVSGPASGGFQAPLRIARFDASGALDTSVAGGAGFRDVSVPVGPVYATRFALMPDGRVVVGGIPNYNQNSSSNTGAIVRYGVDLGDDAIALRPQPAGWAFPLAGGGLIVGTGQGQVTRLLADAEPATCVVSTTTVTSTPNPSSYQEMVTLTATVSDAVGGTPQGSVLFFINGSTVGSSTALTNGAASYATQYMAEGTSTVTAAYRSTGIHESSVSAGHAHTVTPRIPTTTTISISPDPPVKDEVLVITAVVTANGPGVPSGYVRFREKGVFLVPDQPLVNGVATYHMPAAVNNTDSHSLQAFFDGNSTYGFSSSPLLVYAPPGSLSVSGYSANAATSDFISFYIQLAQPSVATITVDYATADNSAKAGIDYTATSGTMTFAPGQTIKGVDVPIARWSGPGPGKDLFFTLSNPTGAVITRAVATGTLYYAAGGTLTMQVDDPQVTEGHAGVTLMGFAVRMSRNDSFTQNVSYATANGTAIAGTDYVAQSGTLTFPPGLTQRWVMVPVHGNAMVDGNRTFSLNLSNASAVVSKPQGIGTILDDDPTPAANPVPMLRLYSDVTKEHLYTTDTNEYSVLGTVGWVQEGTAFTMFSNAGSHGAQHAIPLYRMYHARIRQHHWTTDPNEVMGLAGFGTWAYEGIPGYLLPAAGAGTVPLYRLMYHTPPLHLWTTDLNEKDVLSTQYGWVYEGVVGEVLP